MEDFSIRKYGYNPDPFSLSVIRSESIYAIMGSVELFLETFLLR